MSSHTQHVHSRVVGRADRFFFLSKVADSLLLLLCYLFPLKLRRLRALLCCSAFRRHPAPGTRYSQLNASGCEDSQSQCASKNVYCQAGWGKGETEKGKKPAAQKKRTRTTSQATQTQPLLLAADAFAAALEAIPAEDWCRRLARRSC